MATVPMGLEEGKLFADAAGLQYEIHFYQCQKISEHEPTESSSTKTSSCLAEAFSLSCKHEKTASCQV